MYSYGIFAKVYGLDMALVMNCMAASLFPCINFKEYEFVVIEVRIFKNRILTVAETSFRKSAVFQCIVVLEWNIRSELLGYQSSTSLNRFNIFDQITVNAFYVISKTLLSIEGPSGFSISDLNCLDFIHILAVLVWDTGAYVSHSLALLHGLEIFSLCDFVCALS